MSNEFHAQCGEDTLLAEIFSGQSSGHCIEVGALDGLVHSITLHFEHAGWSCLLVEANPELAAKAKSNRRGQVFSCAAGRTTETMEFVIAHGAEYLSTMLPSEYQLARMVEAGASIERVQVPVRKLDDILAEAGVAHLDFATIDVEGAELDVLLGFDLPRWKPKVLVLEDTSEGHDRRIREYLKTQGYRCFLHADFNDWYARESDKNLLTWQRRSRQFFRQCRLRLYEHTVGQLSAETQARLVAFKRRWLGKL